MSDKKSHAKRNKDGTLSVYFKNAGGYHEQKKEEQCEGCGGKPGTYFACEGAMGHERGQTFGPLNTTLLASCNCCDDCRQKCLSSMIESQPKNKQ